MGEGGGEKRNQKNGTLACVTLIPREITEDRKSLNVVNWQLSCSFSLSSPYVVVEGHEEDYLRQRPKAPSSLNIRVAGCVTLTVTPLQKLLGQINRLAP